MTEQEWVDKLNAVPSTKYSNRWDVKGDVYLGGKNLTKLPLQFGVVTGGFYCRSNKLKTLEGAPKHVSEWFDCSRNKLKTLEGAPQCVGGTFDCSSNDLETLEGLPKRIGGNLLLENNPLQNLNELKEKLYTFVFTNNTENLDSYIFALYNTDLDMLYNIIKIEHRFFYSRLEKDLEMALEQIIVKKRLELILV